MQSHSLKENEGIRINVGVVILLLFVAIGCSTEATYREQANRHFEQRSEYVSGIRSYLAGKERAFVRYSADELKKITSGGVRSVGAFGAAGNVRYRDDSTRTVVDQPYNERFSEEKFSITELNKIYDVLTAVREDTEFRKKLGMIVHLLRSNGTETLNGLRKNGIRGEFTVDYAASEPGGVIHVDRGRTSILFSEPASEQGDDRYVGTRHFLRASEIGTFHGHPNHPGPSPQDLIVAITSHRDSFIIADRGDENGMHRVNMNFVNEKGRGLDLGTIHVPKQSTTRPSKTHHGSTLKKK